MLSQKDFVRKKKDTGGQGGVAVQIEAEGEGQSRKKDLGLTQIPREMKGESHTQAFP